MRPERSEETIRRNELERKARETWGRYMRAPFPHDKALGEEYDALCRELDKLNMPRSAR